MISNLKVISYIKCNFREDDGILMAYDDVIYVEEVVGPIKSNQTLLGKPKVRCLFLQIDLLFKI